jgi:Fe-S cluster biogenesis protein NfuA
MNDILPAVDVKQLLDGSWVATHLPSGRTANGLSQEEAAESMRNLLGMKPTGEFTQPLTSDRFEGLSKEIAEFLEGPVSEMLAMHSGYARLEDFESGVAHIRLGGGCQGCPSSAMTLVYGVKGQLQDRFGETVVEEVIPVL